MNIYYIIGVFFAVQLIFPIAYFLYKKKKDKKEQNEAYERLYPIYSDPDIVKVALWINIDSVNNRPFDESSVYKTNLKNGLLNPNKVEVALFKPGIYTFVVSSNSRQEYQSIQMEVELESGVVYQLGCNDEGPYLVVDPNPARYTLEKVE